MLAALSNDEITLAGALFSRDTEIMITALKSLGFMVIDKKDSQEITVQGLNGYIPRAEATIHVGNAGTVARFLTSMLALTVDGKYKLE